MKDNGRHPELVYDRNGVCWWDQQPEFVLGGYKQWTIGLKYRKGWVGPQLVLFARHPDRLPFDACIIPEDLKNVLPELYDMIDRGKI